MIKGTSSCAGLRCIPALLLLGCALPALSSIDQQAVRASEPSASQRLLIEVHGTTGVGWWSSATREIAEPAG